MPNPLTFEISKLATEASARLSGEVRASLEDLKALGEVAAAKGAEVAQNIQKLLAATFKEQIAPDVAREALERELDAVESLGRGVVEKAKVEAVERVKSALKLAGDAGIKLAEIALAAAVSAAARGVR